MSKRRQRRGFTLVELMIVVAIIGVLAALAIYGVRRYLTAAKGSEAKNNVGSMSRAATAAFEREQMPSQSVTEGSQSAQVSYELCDTAIPLPNTVPLGGKYQPNTAEDQDFQTGDDTTGWDCLRFGIDQPIYYQYQYTRGSSPVAPNNPAVCSGNCYEAGALGDLNANGLFSHFARTGTVNPVTNAIRESTQVYVEAESE